MLWQYGTLALYGQCPQAAGSFETGWDGWKTAFETGWNGDGNIASDSKPFIRWSGSTMTANTGPNGASSGSYYVYTEASNNANKAFEMYKGALGLRGAIPPSLNFTFLPPVHPDFGGSVVTVSFEYSMFGSNVNKVCCTAQVDRKFSF